MTTFSMVRGRVMRATRLDGCGVPTASGGIVTEGFVSVGMSPSTEEGEEVRITATNGIAVVEDRPSPRFKNYSLSITFCNVDPELVSMLTGQPLVYGADGNVTGFRQNSRIDVDLSGFALELWTGVPQACDLDGNPSYGYVLLPFIKGGTLGDFTVENAAINFSVNGATTREGSGWGVGPHNVVRDTAGLPSPLLEPITQGDHLHLELTTLAPPAPETPNAGNWPTEDPNSPGLYTTADQSEVSPGLYSTQGLTEDPNAPGLYLIPV